MRTILYATDCSKSSAPGLKYAVKFSRVTGGQLHVLHVFDLLPIVSANVRSRKGLVTNFRNEQHEFLRQFCLKHLKKEFGVPDLKYHTLRSESISNAIAKTANDINADLTIVGINKPNSLRGVFSEDIANELIPKIGTPLMVIPENIHYEGFSNLMYATDFEEADFNAINFLAAIAKPYNARIHIVHISRRHKDDYERRMDWFRDMIKFKMDYPFITFESKHADDIESGIHNNIQTDKPELLAMMERPKYRFWDKIWHRDMVQTMADEISIPLLVFNKNGMSPQFSEQVNDALLMEWA